MQINCRPVVLTCYVIACGVGSSLAIADDCTDCVSRKKEMCAQECRLVPPEKALLCQSDCVGQYCRHRCSPEQTTTQFNEPSCEDCLDQQFNLCASNCPTGTDRIRAMCQLGCAKQRCDVNCASEK